MNDEQLIEHARRALIHQIEDQDGATLSRLQRVRRQALDRIEQKQGKRWWLPTGIMATAALLILAIGMRLPTVDINPGPMIDDLELLTNSEDMEMLEDDSPEFYLWLADQLK